MGVICFLLIMASCVVLLVSGLDVYKIDYFKVVPGAVIVLLVIPMLIGQRSTFVPIYEAKIQCLEMSGKIDSGSCIIKNTKFEFDQLADLKKAIDLKKVVDKITEGN